MAQQIPIVDYLVPDDPARLEAHACAAKCGGVEFGRKTGNRQIEGARVGLTHVIGLASACAVHILDARPAEVA